MSNLRRARTVGSLALLLTMLASFGCGGKSAYIVRQPAWDYESYERLGVVPAGVADARAGVHAEQLTYLLADELAGNDAFTVVSRQDLAAVMKEQDLALLDLADPETAVPAGRIQIAEALVIPTLVQYELDAFREDRTEPVLRFRDGRIVKVGERVVPVFTHLARVAGSVRIVDAATGAVIFAYSSPPIEAKDEAREKPPTETPESLAGIAVRELARDLYIQLAPIRVKVRFEEDMLFLARDYYDGRYDTLKRVSLTDPSFLLVVRDLPDAADRNPFIVTITEKDGRIDLIREEFIWSAATRSRGVVFDVPTAVLADTPATEFTAKLYAVGNDEPVLTRDFELTQEDVEARREGAWSARSRSSDDDDDDDDDDDEEDDD